MTYLKDTYQRFLASPRNAPLAANASLIYVPTTTKIEGADAIATHTSRQASIVRKKSDQVLNAIESSDALCLDMETTLEFLEGGGAYLPSLDDNFLADRVVTIPTVHIVHFNAEQQIQQVRIYWDQASLLKEMEVIGARGRSWPIRPAQEQVRLLKSALEAKSAAPVLVSSSDANKDLPARPASPGKRYIKDPYSADSLFDLLSPQKGEGATEQDDDRRPSSPGKRYTRDPYAAGSLTELLSPSKEESAPPRPYAPSAAQPASRQYGELFIGDDDETPSTPSKAEKVAAPKAGSKFQGSRIFGDNDDATDERAPYKTNPLKFNHFEIGAVDADPEIKDHVQRGKSRNQSQWHHGDTTTPKKNTEKARGFGYGDDNAEAESPPARPAVHKPRRDADVHFDMTDDTDEDDDGRIISSFENRGKGLYENRLFNEDGTPKAAGDEKRKPESLGVTGNNVSRSQAFDSHWEMTDVSPAASHKTPKPMAMDRAKAVQMMESSWDNYDQSPEPTRTATSLHNPARHNQPSWTMGDDE
ncbi:hypothetical protein PEBR_08135 [Penicillium brasilianum]|uniref:Uncharacterized protein n=1 Tax=Penicillium brasilianum TaxID=104259 RepID=A0A1S9RWI6_PENBI|nr:hypothetical protein PEBR_08135 [Penicillium brasilianum]